jgi:hypothetical protein
MVPSEAGRVGVEGVIGLAAKRFGSTSPDRRVLSWATGISGRHAWLANGSVQDMRRERTLIESGGITARPIP